MRGKETVRIQHFGDPDRSGERQPDDAAVVVKGCFVIPRMSAADAERGERVISGFTVVLPPGTDISSTDELEVRGETFVVDGVPGDFGRKGIIAVLAKAGDVDG